MKLNAYWLIDKNYEGVKFLKRLDMFDEVADYVMDNDIENGEEILVSLDGRDICKAKIIRDGDEIEFKVIALR